MNQFERAFDYKGNNVRTFMRDEETWFVARDVCNILEIGNPSQALSRLDDDEKADIILNDGRQKESLLRLMNQVSIH